LQEQTQMRATVAVLPALLACAAAPATSHPEDVPEEVVPDSRPGARSGSRPPASLDADAASVDAADAAADGPEPTPVADAGAADTEHPSRDGSPSERFSGPPPPLPAAVFGSPRCQSSFQVCLDFEGGLPPGWGRSGDVAVDATRAARGNRSLRVSAGAGRNVLSSAWRGGTTVYGRAFLWFTNPPTGHGEVVTLNGRTTAGEDATYNLGISDSRFVGSYLRFNPRDERVSECRPAFDRGRCDVNTTLILRDQWVCVEWEIDGATGRAMRLWYNGAPLDLRFHASSSAASATRWPAMRAFSGVAVGLSMYFGERPGTHLWIDELVLDEQRIGCER
jgi:hypothetical protein